MTANESRPTENDGAASTRARATTNGSAETGRTLPSDPTDRDAVTAWLVAEVAADRWVWVRGRGWANRQKGRWTRSRVEYLRPYVRRALERLHAEHHRRTGLRVPGLDSIDSTWEYVDRIKPLVTVQDAPW